MKCNKCGAENDESSRFCGKCGHELLKELSCSKCGKTLKPDAVFCVECGAKVGTQTSVVYPRASAEAEATYLKLNNPSSGNRGFFGRMSTGKWLFAIAICVTDLLVSTWNSSHHPNINYRFIFFSDIVLVFIPYLIVAAYFFDFKNETHTGWRGAYIAAQILIPAWFVWNHETHTSLVGRTPDVIISFNIMLIGVVETAVLALVKFSMWLRKGAAAKNEK